MLQFSGPVRQIMTNPDPQEGRVIAANAAPNSAQVTKEPT